MKNLKTAIEAILDMPHTERHISEILRFGKLCKGFGDLDNENSLGIALIRSSPIQPV